MKSKAIPYRCAICGNEGRWHGRRLVLQIDHINGDHYDNRLSNLRFLCPNCHSQTETYGVKNQKFRPRKTTRPKNVILDFVNEPGTPKIKKRFFCKRCGKEITRFSKKGLCPECAPFQARRAERPLGKDLLVDVYLRGVMAVSRDYGITDNNIRKWLMRDGLPIRKAEIAAYVESHRWANQAKKQEKR